MRACVLAALACAFALPTHATTWNVSPDGTGDVPKIQDAVDAAADGDLILLADGTFLGDRNRDIDFLGKAITVRSASGNRDACIIDCEGARRGFSLRTGEGAGSTLEDLTILRGNNGILTLQSSPLIRNVVMRSCTATFGGGGLYVWGGAPTITGCVLEANSSSFSWGGGILMTASDALVEKTVISGNDAPYYYWGSGGGVFVDGGRPTFRDCAITGNRASCGGGVSVRSQTDVRFERCTISRNHATRLGGGVQYAALGGPPLAIPTFDHTIVWGNCAPGAAAQLWLAGGPAAAEFICSLVDSTGIGGTTPPVWLSGNVFDDPLFCGPLTCGLQVGGDYRVDGSSPALGAPGCGRIGALSQGCGTVGVGANLDPLSWGRIRASTGSVFAFPLEPFVGHVSAPGQVPVVIALVTLTLLPLAVIGVQLALDLDRHWGVFGYSLYKVFFLVPPLIYCRVLGIGVFSDILKLRNWNRCLPAAAWIGGLAVVVFWGTYYLLGDVLLDTAMIVEKIGDQFSVTLGTVFLIAPVTIFANSLLEEFFYRGFAFGLLVKRHRWLGSLLPATAFTVQHTLFIHHWLTPLPLAIAVGGLFVFALVLQRTYERADSIVAPWLIHALGDVAMMGIAVTMLWGRPALS